jgi:hypothetical protein
MGSKRTTGLVGVVAGVAVVALGVAAAVTADAELWWINVIFPGLIVVAGVIVAWTGWNTLRST